MLTKFRNFMDRMSMGLMDLITSSLIEKNCIETLEREVLLCEQRISQLEKQISALKERNGELEHANENLLIQRMEVRKRLDELGRYFPK